MDAAWLLTAWLLSIRLGALAMLAPPLAAGLVPASVRVAIVVTLAAVLATGASPTTQVSERNDVVTLGQLVAAAGSEAALGATMALGLNMAFAMFTFGARLLDVQIGFGMGQVFDPMTRQQLPVLSAIFNQLALVGFFVFEGHHALLRGLALSVQAVPPGTDWVIGNAVAAAAKQAAQLFSLGFAMVAPVVFCLMLVELGLGVLARNLPQMNTLVVGVPIKVVVGLTILSAWIGTSGSVMQRAYRSTFAMWGALWQ